MAGLVGGILKYSGIQSKANAEANAANFNAYVNTENANQALQESAEKERQQRVHSSQVIGQERATYGASGVDSASGSAADVIAQSARNAELDALQIRHSGQMKVWAYQTGAALDVSTAANAHIAGNYSAASSLIDSATQAAESAMKLGAGGK